ncbi:hypothetical protein K1719_029103 [Acacia pycnantha]|nr:hypothetical protein K1719_029103 [Acacia pycnantha]
MTKATLFARSTGSSLISRKKSSTTSNSTSVTSQVAKNPTYATIVPPPVNSTTTFKLLNMIDNPLTLGPKLSSKLMGRAQGFYAYASQSKRVSTLMVMNFVFIEGNA